MPLSAILGIIGLIITYSTFTLGIAFKLGHHSARLEALESWRSGIRDDMHEISDKMEEMASSLRELTTVIEERTERRVIPRH